MAPFTLRALIVGVPVLDVSPKTSEQGAPAQLDGLDLAVAPITWPVAGSIVTTPAIRDDAFTSVLKPRLSPSKPPPKLSKGLSRAMLIFSERRLR